MGIWYSFRVLIGLILCGGLALITYHFLIDAKLTNPDNAAIISFIVFTILCLFVYTKIQQATKERSRRKSRDTIPSDLRNLMLLRFGGKCAWCGSRTNVEVDHITPVSEGGATTPQNLQLLCRNCNRSKGASLI